MLKRCLEKDPNRRYPRAAEIASELKRAASRNASDDEDTSATQEVAEQTSDPTLEKTAEKTVPAPASEAPTMRMPALAPRPAPVPPAAPVAIAPPPAPPPAVLPGVAPVATVPVSQSSGQRQVSEALSRIRNQRIVKVGLISLALIAAAAIALLWVRDSGVEIPDDTAVVATVEEARRAALQAALDEARGALGRGDLQVALKAVARVEAADPANTEAKALRAEIEGASRDMAGAAEREQQVANGLILAREEFSKRRYEPAIAAATAVLALAPEHAPEHAEATKLLADSEAALARQKERQRAARLATESTAPGTTPTPAVPAGPVLAKPVPVAPAPAGDAVLGIEFFSEASEGTLTIYAGERQIVREAFKFVRKTGFLRSEKISGTLNFQRTLPSGPISLRVYVSTPGKPTRSVLLEKELAGGTSPKLGIQVDGEGRTTATLF